MKNRPEQIYDELLILRCQDGDREAVELFVHRWQAPLIRFANIVTRDPELAQEAVQDAWLSIIRNLMRLRDPAQYRSWMFRIVHNKCIDALRVPRSSDTGSDEQAAPGRMDQLEDREQINHVLRSLTEAHRAVLAFHYLYDMSVAEISVMLSVPEGTVKSRLFNAREAFRQVLDNGGKDHERSGQTDRTSVEEFIGLG